MAPDRCRYAPTPSGPAHPGTLLAGLLAWLDARKRDAHLLLRLEDVDHARCTAEHARELERALGWLGLDWDAVAVQSQRRGAHEAALDRLAERGLLYPCTCSRAEVRRAGLAAADGGFRYPGTCRERALPAGGWRNAESALRLRLPAEPVACRDEGGLPLPQHAAEVLGDPVLLRKDGAIAYHLAVVVDDATDGITRIVRGRDLAPVTAIHVALQRALGLATPRYRHHFLLLEAAGDTLAKLHGSIGWDALARGSNGPDTCGALAHAAGLLDAPRAIRPEELLDDFDWERVRSDDLVATWDGRALAFAAPGAA